MNKAQCASSMCGWLVVSYHPALFKVATIVKDATGLIKVAICLAAGLVKVKVDLHSNQG